MSQLKTHNSKPVRPTFSRSLERTPARLIVIAGEQVGRWYEVGESLTIGRSDEAELVLNDPLVSRLHARVRRTPHGFELDDLDSCNGTTRNGVPVQTTPFHSGDTICMGSHVLRLSCYDEAELRVRTGQRLEVLGRLGAGIAHEFNNMLAVARASLDFVDALPGDTQLCDPEVHECMNDIHDALDRAGNLADRLLSSVRSDQSGHDQVDVSNLCRDVLKLVTRTFRRKIAVTHRIDQNLFVVGDSAELHQVVMNLCLNARDAMPEGGTLDLRARLLPPERLAALSLPSAVSHLVLTIEDTGIGMDEPTRRRIFEPFFTTKAADEGTGIGLAEVRDIIHIHGGRIGVMSDPGRGTTFSVYLPASTRDDRHDRLARQPVEAPKPSAFGTRLTILLVDDEEAVRRAFRRLLRQAGYQVLEASSGHEAVQVFQLTDPQPSLVILDLDMPSATGEETQRLLRKIEPDVRVLGISGHNSPKREEVMRQDGAIAILHKPVSVQHLLQSVKDGLTVENSMRALERRQSSTTIDIAPETLRDNEDR